MPRTPTDLTLGYLVLDVARMMSANFEARTRSIGVTRAQWSLIGALVRAEGCNQAQLAELMQITPISLGRLVDRMETAGWVERRAEAGDRRSYRLFLTAKAHAIRPALRRLSDATQDEALAALDPAARRQLLDSLAQVRATLAGRQAPERRNRGGRS
ncbi:MAG: MarR family transcriptional regulator [Steroidobacteraceae bacterium]|nr:MarR family transcriptional regulator [Steroidobacteraceae bacterium]